MTTKSVALFGNVNTEEIVARYLGREGTLVDGFLFFPNDAFARACNRAVLMSDEYRKDTLINELRNSSHCAIFLGPIFASLALADFLTEQGIAYIGATPKQLHYEIDKSAIFDVFQSDKGVVPKTAIVTEDDEKSIRTIMTQFTGGFVVKFVGDYSQQHRGSETGRVRFADNSIDAAVTFVRSSLATSQKALVQELCTGQEFSANYAVDAKGHYFRLGENICYKRRYAGNTGPLCDGTGSVAINGTVPFLTKENIDNIEQQILSPFLTHVAQATGQPLRTILNLDLMKCDDGRVVLFEINCREAGGHTMANVLSGQVTPLTEILTATQNDQLDKITPQFRTGASLVISAYPPYFPWDLPDGDTLLEFDIPKDIPDDIAMYTGWVEILKEDATTRHARLRNSPTLLFEHRAENMRTARERLVPFIQEATQGVLEFRHDIGKELEDIA